MGAHGVEQTTAIPATHPMQPAVLPSPLLRVFIPHLESVQPASQALNA